MSDIWKYVNSLRETTIDIMNGWYSQNYAEKNKSGIKSWACSYGDHPSVWIPEMLELKEDEKGNLMYRIDENNSPYRKSESEFYTSAGMFISENNGEFGGKLITPKSILRGNFNCVFECDGIIYAIDSLAHMGVRHMTIYRFTEDLSADIVYSTCESDDTMGFFQSFSLDTWSIKDNIIYVLASGEVNKDSNSEWISKSILLKIESGKLIKKTEYDFAVYQTRNMIVTDDKIYVGADKVVVVIDIATNEVVAYTPISHEDEENILSIRDVYLS
ncbi:MAG: hypothetical protein IJF18_02105 [Oscillospiraceae bacterium]|nr:hypothetical protein [Oscillospiraceae bacterium]